MENLVEGMMLGWCIGIFVMKLISEKNESKANERIKELEKLNGETLASKICPHCGKYKCLQGNGIMHQLCECGE